MIPTTAKIQMIVESITVKTTEASNPFGAFLMICAGLYYFFKNWRKATIGTVVGGTGLVATIMYFIDKLIGH